MYLHLSGIRSQNWKNAWIVDILSIVLVQVSLNHLRCFMFRYSLNIHLPPPTIFCFWNFSYIDILGDKICRWKIDFVRAKANFDVKEATEPFDVGKLFEVDFCNCWSFYSLEVLSPSDLGRESQCVGSSRTFHNDFLSLKFPFTFQYLQEGRRAQQQLENSFKQLENVSSDFPLTV